MPPCVPYSVLCAHWHLLFLLVFVFALHAFWAFILQIGGKTAHITIGMRDGFVVARAFNPASERERELQLTPGQLKALLPSHLHGDEHEVEQLHWISHKCVIPRLACVCFPSLRLCVWFCFISFRALLCFALLCFALLCFALPCTLSPTRGGVLCVAHDMIARCSLHYVRARSGKVELKLVPPESKHFIPELTADDDDIQAEESDDEEGDLSTVMLFRNQVRVRHCRSTFHARCKSYWI